MKGQGTIIIGAVVFIIILAIALALYIDMMNSLSEIGSALNQRNMMEELKSKELLNINTIVQKLKGKQLHAVMNISNIGSVTTKIKYVLLACFTESGYVKYVADIYIDKYSCNYALSPGENRICSISHKFSAGCSYATITIVTAYGNSYTMVIR